MNQRQMNKVALPLAYSYLNKIYKDVIGSNVNSVKTVIWACVHTHSDPDGENEKWASV